MRGAWFIPASITVALVLASLGAGIAGHRFFEDPPFIDAFLNAAMPLGGMGPVNLPVTPGGKVFAGVYAL